MPKPVMNTKLKLFATRLPVFLVSSSANGIAVLAEITFALKQITHLLPMLNAVLGSEAVSQLEKDVY